MHVGEWIASEVEYGRDLADSGWHGARTALDNALQQEPAGELLSRTLRASWAPAVLGAGVGAVCALLLPRRKSGIPGAAIALGVTGSLLGFAAGVAWETRDVSSEVARSALREISSTRDTRWLKKHPINFG